MTRGILGRRTCRCALAGLVLLSGPALSASEPPASVVACDSLVSLRLLTAGASDAASVASRLAAQPGCRRIARADVGAVEQRAMIGGAPFECLTVAAQGRCLWVMP